MKLPKPRLRERFQSFQSRILLVIVAYAIVDSLTLTQFSAFTREPVISQISGQFITVEGILVATTPLMKRKRTRDILALMGLPALLASVGTFATSTYQEIQLGYSSYFPTTLLFWADGLLFLLFVESYAVAILLPFTQKPKKDEAPEPLETDLTGLD